MTQQGVDRQVDQAQLGPGGFGDFIVDTTSAEQVALEGRLLAGKSVPGEGENSESAIDEGSGQPRVARDELTSESGGDGPQDDRREAGVKDRRAAHRLSDHSTTLNHHSRPSSTGPSRDEAEPFRNYGHDRSPNWKHGNSQRQNSAFSQQNAHHSAQSGRSSETGQNLSHENALLRLGVSQRAQQEEARSKSIVAQQLVQQHGLSRSDYTTLLGTSSPKAMVQVAKRIASSSRAARVPAETAETQLESGFSVGSGDESEDQRFNRVINKMGRDWTESELRYMKGGK